MSLFFCQDQKTQKIRPSRWGVLDLETDQLEDARAVQIGLTVCEGVLIKSSCSQLLNPERPITTGASDVHGITDAIVADKPRFRDVAPEWHGALTQLDFLVTYNGSRFDDVVMQRQMTEAGFPEYRPHSIDLFAFFKWKRRHQGRLTLADVCDREGVELGRAHDAASDSSATAQLFVIAVGAGDVPDDLEEAKRQSVELGRLLDEEYARYQYYLYRREDGILRLGYGRHVGVPLSRVDRGFLRWALSRRTPIMPQEVVELFQLACAGRYQDTKPSVP